MDLKLIEAAPTERERAAIDAALAGVVISEGPAAGRLTVLPPTSMAAREQRSLLLPALHAAQAASGWLSPGAVGYICERLDVPPAEAYGVASFYALFALEERPPRTVHVCDDLACLANGAEALCRALEEQCGPAGRHDGEQPAIWLRGPCLGLCERAPAALVTDAGDAPRETLIGPVDSGVIASILSGAPPPERPATRLEQAGSATLRLLRRIGKVDPVSLDDYRAAGGYQALRRALAIGPLAVIREVTDARLVGRGGAAFPTGRKWQAVATAPVHPHLLVCNADESEPGTFKDRILMEEDPFALIEAMTIAAFATGCERGYIYVRAEYPLAAERLTAAITEARTRGLLGDNILGHGFHFDLELRRGAGAYICGEETALFNSIEGFRGEPRNKPPYPVDAGLFGLPTVVNNVETLVNVLDIVRDGGPAYAALGTPDSAGLKLFCVSGHVQYPGLYEVPFGATLRDLLDLAGGLQPGRSLQAVLLGGAAGSFVTADQLEMPLTFAGTRAAGTTLGSGVILVFDDSADLRPVLRRVAAFFRDESCGQCVPCRVGTVRQEEALARLNAGTPLGSAADELALIAEIGQAMRDASICGLGHTASSAVESAIARLNVYAKESGG